MSTRINWTNPSTPFDEVRIYRTDAPFDDATIPASPLVVLTGKETTYLDTTTFQNIYYYYTIAVVVNGEIILASPKRTIHIPYTGPGPQEIQIGDNARGFFGLLTSTEMFTGQELCALCGVASPNTSNGQWAKFIRNGKILFMSLYPISNSSTWNNQYLSGCAYGTGDNGPATGHGLTPTLQRKIVTKGEHSFSVRLMRAADTADYSVTAADYSKGELATLLLSIMNQGRAKGSEILADFPSSTYINTNQAFCIEFNGANCMGLATTADIYPANGNITRTGAYLWRPVLELVV